MSRILPFATALLGLQDDSNSLARLAEENGFPIRQFFGSQVTAEAVSEYVLNVSTVDPDPILPLRLYFCTIPSAKAIQDSPDTYDSNLVGTGPYKLKEWNRGQYIDLVANEDWWGRDDPAAALGTNELVTEARYIFRSESTVRAAMLDTGEADFARFLNPAGLSSIGHNLLEVTAASGEATTGTASAGASDGAASVPTGTACVPLPAPTAGRTSSSRSVSVTAGLALSSPREPGRTGHTQDVVPPPAPTPRIIPGDGGKRQPRGWWRPEAYHDLGPRRSPSRRRCDGYGVGSMLASGDGSSVGTAVATGPSPAARSSHGR